VSVFSYFQEEILGLMSPSKRFSWEGPDRAFDGKPLELLVHGSISPGYEEDWSKVIVSIGDISERKRAEEEIRRRAKETSALLETSLTLTNLDLRAILQSIGNSAKSLFAADGCRVFLMQSDGVTLRCVLALQENATALSDLQIKLGEGVTGAVALSGRAEIVNEMQNDSRAVQVAGTQEAEEEAIMFAPLKERDRTIGVLSIRRSGVDHPFQSVDLELLEAFASMAAAAVSNARLYEEAQRRLSELEALYENGLAVGQLLEPRQIAERIIQTFAHYLSWHHVTIRILKPDSDELELIAFNLPGLKDEEKSEMEQHFNNVISKVGQGLSGKTVQTGVALRTGNVHAHPGYALTQSGIQSGLYMPLKIGERVIGVVSVESEAPDAFTEQDERLLATLASQAAVAFENARLYQAAQQELLERTRAQAALWASETHYRELADSITDILFELDYDLNYTHWNRACEIFSGIPAKDAIGTSMQTLFGTSEEQSKREEIYKSVLTERQAKTFETEILARGQKRVLEIHAYPSTRGVSVVARDVTERKSDEILMQKRFELIEFSSHHSSKEVLQRVVDEISELTESNIGFLHFIKDDEATSDLETWSTETLQDFCHVEDEEMLYTSDQAGVWADAIRQRRSLILNDYESLTSKKGIPESYAKVTREMAIPLIRNENIVAIIGVGNKAQEYTPHDLEITERFADYAWDIIERRQMETALADERNQLARRVEERTADLSRANSNLARALRVKDEFLANMSHELRTPLNAILGLSESLGEQVAGPLNEKQQKYLNTINESGHHLLSLINDILDLAKIEAGQITLDINKVDVNAVCQASLRMIKQLAQKKDQEVLFDIDSDIGLMWADERRLKQMIVNLLSNAVKFTPEAGKFGLEVHGDQAGNRIMITVWDKGIGITNQDLERLFQPFVQLDAGLAREATGTGLGLALVAQMARLHGGSVNVESQVGEGSRFTIQLPWEPALAADVSTRLRNTGKFRAIDLNEKNKPTLLIIEDTREVVMMLVDYLEMSGFKMATAQDGSDGIQQAKLAHPDLILMDVMMPGMDGFETTRKLRMDPQFKDTPIIGLTALAMPSDRQRCLDAGMDEYISKPVNLKALVKLIRSILLEKEETKSR
jgi:PAS domain S-box-containing protein